MKIVNVEQMVELERRSAEVGAPPEILMENAGLAVARTAMRLLGEMVAGRSILILVGPGNNGGDGLVAARHLHDWLSNVHMFLFKRTTNADKNFALDMERGVPWTDVSSDKSLSTLDEALSSADMVIDSLFGTGKTRPIEGVMKQALDRVKAAKTKRPELKILAVDLPSGLNADTGAVDPSCLTADLTLTLGYPKIGLFQFPGATKLGELQVADIGIPPHLAQDIQTELITAADVRSLLPPRPPDANKGTFGRLLVVAGSINYVGAAYLACEGAMRVGTGLVTLAVPKSLHPILAGKLIETTYVPLPESEAGIIGVEAAPVVKERLPNYEAMLLGCGLGQNTATIEFVKKLLPSVKVPMVIDADGLNILAQVPRWGKKLKTKVVLTPHPGEMARLLGASIPEIQSNRLMVALQAAQAWGQTVVLKGAYTVIASPDGRARISSFANPGLASAGTGDVLAGAIAGMLAQGLSPFDAATVGVYLHAQAGELVKAELGDTGMIASDLLPKLPLVIKNAGDDRCQK